MQKLLKREKSGVSDFDADVARTIVKNKRYKEETENDQFDDEPGGPKTSKKSRKRQLSHENSLRKQAIKDYHKQNEKEKSCYYCFSNKKIPKHLIMSLGNTTYLMLPPKPLCEGHAWIVPLLHHTGGMVSMEEDVWEEVEKFMKCLTKMNYKQKKGTVFFETVVHLKSEPHSIIECVPLSEAEAANGPIYFKKAILEEGSHWAQHAKLIDTTGKGIRKSIPPHQFPYFYVQFGMTQGMAHIIEKEHKFKSSFGLEVLAGITDNDSYFTEGRQSRSKLDEIESTKSFLKNWMPFDWTTELDGGEI
uniref:Cwf19-like C-terminal domain-containing protein n=1 Tax=Arcella intermedia TaxID=1963864 RepID=A0A6B2LAU4_9EUKA